jgi:Reverse transcriptase (RNA-dependent DNA polymerase)
MGSYTYSRNQLYAYRYAAGRPTWTVVAVLKDNQLLRYRGVRAGTRKHRSIDVIVSPRRTARALRRAPLSRNLVTVSRHPTTAAQPRTSRNSTCPPPSIYVINARSLAKPYALEQLLADLIGYDIGLAIITETHYKTHHLQCALRTEGFRLFRRDRLARRAGGVAILVRDEFPATEFNVAEDERNIELLWVRITHPGGAIYVGALYHPPRPIYEKSILLARLERSVETISLTEPGAVIILGGDLNALEESEVIGATGLIPLVHQPTRGNNILDRLFVSQPLYTSIKILASSVKTDHKAIIATSTGQVHSRNKQPVKVKFRRRTPQMHAALLTELSRADLSHIYAEADPQSAWDRFYRDALDRLDRVYPMRTITITSADPFFITPESKQLLRRKNRLMRAGRIEEASACARRVGQCIERVTRAHLRGVDPRDGSRDLWKRVNDLTKGTSRAEHENAPSVSDFNVHYARISTDDGYTEPAKKSTAASNRQFTSEYRVFNILDRLHHTADGPDRLPAWYLRLSAPAYSGVLAYLINFSVQTSHVPIQWKSAIIHPVPKVDLPVTPADYRPISIVSILSRLVEREIVQTYMYPAFCSPPTSYLLDDQYAFRPSGSTTAAIISMLHHVTSFLQTEDHVALVCLDFSKAFDTVRHSVLAQKLSKLDLPDNIYNWLVEFLQGRSHSTRYGGHLSNEATINSSVVQGSGVGPAAFAVNVSDLHPVHQQNKIVKYADDTYLIVPASMRSTLATELDALGTWATRNHLKLNVAKSREMVFTRRSKTADLPLPLLGVERVESMVVLGVTISSDLRASKHIDRVLGSCSSSLYALGLLRAHGLPPTALHGVARATTTSRLLYAAPAWWGFTTADDRSRLERFHSKMCRMGFLSPDLASIESLVGDLEGRLLRAVISHDSHVLRGLFPPRVQRTYSLRPRPHNFELPKKDDKNFIPRVLYRHRCTL